MTPLRSSRPVALTLVACATFTDIVAYSIAVPVLPDLSHRLGASPTTIGLLFSSFGVTLLAVSLPMGTVSDRVGRKAPLVGGMIALAASTLLLAFADRLAWLFAARFVQGAADAVTWVVGFALLADVYGPDERGRAMGIVMSTTGLGLMVGPSVGGWLYEVGGLRLPFLVVAVLAAAVGAAFGVLDAPTAHAARERTSMAIMARQPAVVACVLIVTVASATVSMLEPVWPLVLASRLALRPGQIGLIFGIGALCASLLNPIYGRLADRWGGRRLMMAGLAASAAILPAFGLATGFGSAAVVHALEMSAVALVITPSLAYMAALVTGVGMGSFGVAYGLYNFGWGVGLLGGPALGGFLLERIGFSALTVTWALAVGVAMLGLGAVRPSGLSDGHARQNP